MDLVTRCCRLDCVVLSDFLSSKQHVLFKPDHHLLSSPISSPHRGECWDKSERGEGQ